VDVSHDGVLPGEAVVLPRKQAMQQTGLGSGVAFPVESTGAIGAIEVYAHERSPLPVTNCGRR